MNLTCIYSEIPLDLLLIYTINYRVCHRIYSQKPRLLFHTHFFGFIPFQAIYDEATPPPPTPPCKMHPGQWLYHCLWFGVYFPFSQGFHTDREHPQSGHRPDWRHPSVPGTVGRAPDHCLRLQAPPRVGRHRKQSNRGPLFIRALSSDRDPFTVTSLSSNNDLIIK